MATILISLVSDQNVQNVLFIRELQHQSIPIDCYLFLTTKEMQEKGALERIKNALALTNAGNPIPIESEKIVEVLISEFDLQEIIQKLQEIIQNPQNIIQKLQTETTSTAPHTYLLNLTGGTKIMSLASYEALKNVQANIYYVTGRNNEYLQVYPNQQTRSFTYQLSLLEYIKSYGISLKNSEQNIHELQNKEENTKELYKIFNSTGFNKQFLSDLRDKLEKLKDKLPSELQYKGSKEKIHLENLEKELKTKELSDLLRQINYTEPYITKHFARYLTGTWLEEYTYSQIKKVLRLNNQQIGKGLRLQKNNVMNKGDNDFDVMFIWKNELYIIECKTSHKINGKSALTEYIYKLDALRKEFGIFAKAYIFTLTELSNPEKDKKDKSKLQEQEQITERLKFHNITLLTHEPEILSSQQLNFHKFLSKLQFAQT